jgi:hypothetical protein
VLSFGTYFLLEMCSWVLSSFSIQFICTTPNIVFPSDPHSKFNFLK